MASEQSVEMQTDTTATRSPLTNQNDDSLHPALQDVCNYEAPMDNEPPWSEDCDTPVQFHSHMAPYALKALLDGGITVVEYGSQLRFRCGYAEVLILIEYAIPDHQLQTASQILIDSDLPLIMSSWRDRYDGIWAAQALSHDLDGAAVERVNLLPLSLVGLTLEETTEVPSTFDRDLHLLSPTPPRYFLSLLRLLLRLPIGDVSRNRVKRDIYIFIAQYLMHGLPAHTPSWVIDAESDESYHQRVEQGVRELRTWNWEEADERMLDIAERAIRETDYINNLTDVVAPPPSNEPERNWEW